MKTSFVFHCIYPELRVLISFIQRHILLFVEYFGGKHASFEVSLKVFRR